MNLIEIYSALGRQWIDMLSNDVSVRIFQWTNGINYICLLIYYVKVVDEVEQLRF